MQLNWLIAIKFHY